MSGHSLCVEFLLVWSIHRIPSPSRFTLRLNHLVVLICTHRNSWLNTAVERSYCYWIVSGDGCLGLPWIQSVDCDFFTWLLNFGRTLDKPQHLEWPTPLWWWRLTAACSSPAWKTNKRRKSAIIRGCGHCSTSIHRRHRSCYKEFSMKATFFISFESLVDQQLFFE